MKNVLFSSRALLALSALCMAPHVFSMSFVLKKTARRTTPFARGFSIKPKGPQTHLGEEGFQRSQAQEELDYGTALKKACKEKGKTRLAQEAQQAPEQFLSTQKTIQEALDSAARLMKESTRLPQKMGGQRDFLKREEKRQSAHIQKQLNQLAQTSMSRNSFKFSQALDGYTVARTQFEKLQERALDFCTYASYLPALPQAKPMAVVPALKNNNSKAWVAGYLTVLAGLTTKIAYDTYQDPTEHRMKNMACVL